MFNSDKYIITRLSIQLSMSVGMGMPYLCFKYIKVSSYQVFVTILLSYKLCNNIFISLDKSIYLCYNEGFYYPPPIY